MPDDVVVRFTTRGAHESAADVDKLRDSARQLGPDVERSSAQADAGVQTASKSWKDYGFEADKARAAAAAVAAAADKAGSSAGGTAQAVERSGRAVDTAAQRSSRSVGAMSDGVRELDGVSPVFGLVADALDAMGLSGIGAAGGLGFVTVAAEEEAVAAGSAATATGLLDLALGGLPLILSLVAGGFSLWSQQHRSAAKSANDYQKAVEEETSALYANVDAQGASSRADFVKRLSEKGVVDDLRRTGLTLDEVRAGVQGSEADWHKLDDQLFNNKNATAALADALFGLHQDYVKGTASGADLAAIGAVVEDSFDAQKKAADAAAEAASHYSSAIDTALSSRPGGGAERDLADEQDKLQKLLADDGSKEHAQRQRDAAKAQIDATHATQAREAAERKLGEINRRNLADEIARAAVERDRAAMSVEQANAALAEAVLHQQRVGAAGGSEKARADADRAVRDGRIKVREATSAAADAEAKYKDVASGAALERDRAAAVQSVADARSAEKEATDKLGKALADASVPASQLGATSKEIADQVDRVVRAAVAANVALVPMLEGLGARFPQIADAVERIVAAIRTVNENPGLMTGARVGDPGPGAPGGPAFNPNARAGGGPVGAHDGVRRYLVGERGAEVLDMYANGGGWVYANSHPITQSVLGRATGGDVGFGNRASVSGYASRAHVLVVEKTTREGDFTGNILVQGMSFEQAERQARRKARQRANSRVSRGR